ncbi:Wzz/FepE/Etk N-terminal domain-containing protein [Rhizobium sp. AAP43]|uniref:tyrosine-protein kinase domain-containing protein n=1 Tax=Rhizobium sp. AAP43 TaxID=1523420 RepID=UPI0006B98315|nr:Wzz/FepE/Etk N-terminal domain-containing protein [Rhizobium sp. AAP43]
MSTNQSFQRLPALSMFPQSGKEEPFSLADVTFFVRRRFRIIASVPLVTVGLTLIYLLMAEPSYVASTQLLVSPQINSGDAARALAEDTFIEGEIEIARASDVLRSAAINLNLTSDPQFTDTTSLRDRIKSALLNLVSPSGQPDGASAGTDQEAMLDLVVAKLRNVTWARRIGRSMVVEISASANSRERSAEIADMLARAYIAKNLEMKSQSAQQYSNWLERLVNEQQGGLTKAANDLAAFRANPKDQYRLAELESQAQARRNLFESTLTAFTEAKQRVSSPVSDATIVSPATPPLSKASPRSTLLLAFSLLVGLGLGLMIAMLAHAADRRITRRSPIADVAGVSVLARIRRLPIRSLAPCQTGGDPEVPPSDKVVLRRMPELEVLTPLLLNLRRKRKTAIGVIGIGPGCGASTIAREMALQSAASGARTLLVDTVGGKASLSRLLNHDGSKGLIKALSSTAPLADLTVDLNPNLHFLPCGQRDGVSPAVRLGSRTTKLTLATMKADYDTIIFDIAAVEDAPDANALSPELDTVLLVAIEGQTTLDALAKATGDLRLVGADVAGAIINKSRQD